MIEVRYNDNPMPQQPLTPYERALARFEREARAFERLQDQPSEDHQEPVRLMLAKAGRCEFPVRTFYPF